MMNGIIEGEITSLCGSSSAGDVVYIPFPYFFLSSSSLSHARALSLSSTSTNWHGSAAAVLVAVDYQSDLGKRASAIKRDR